MMWMEDLVGVKEKDIVFKEEINFHERAGASLLGHLLSAIAHALKHYKQSGLVVLCLVVLLSFFRIGDVFRNWLIILVKST